MSLSERHRDTHRQSDSNTSIGSHLGNYELVRVRDRNCARHRHVISGRHPLTAPPPAASITPSRETSRRYRIDCIAHDYLLSGPATLNTTQPPSHLLIYTTFHWTLHKHIYSLRSPHCTAENSKPLQISKLDLTSWQHRQNLCETSSCFTHAITLALSCCGRCYVNNNNGSVEA